MNEIEWSRNKIFIAAPRELSAKRFTEIIKHYLPKGNIILGISEEPYVVGFEGQPQFKMLQQEVIQAVVDKVAESSSPNKIHLYRYAQNELPNIVAKLNESQRILLVNGSWKYAFHNSEAYKILTTNNVPVKFISPFIDEDEARAYEAAHSPQLDFPAKGTVLTESELFAIADEAALQSYDYSFQTGVALARKNGDGYEYVTAAFNKVIPYQTYALLHGNSREKHLSPPGDTNYYDTIHAEMALLVEATGNNIDLKDTTLFINLLPCPNCARTLSQTSIGGIVYRYDHSNGYAADLLKMCGKKVKRVS